MPRISYYCQKCGAGNPVGTELCEKCGTRVLLIVEPPSARYEINHATPYEEHLLERISWLENYLGRLTDRFERILDVMMRQAQTAYLDHTLLESVIALLDGSGVIESKQVNAVWQMRRTIDSARREKEEQRHRLATSIFSHPSNPNSPQFTAIVEAGLKHLEEGQTGRGIKALEKALLQAPHNAPLLFVLGRHFYFAKKYVLARDYLSQGFTQEPHNGLTCLLLGVLYGDRGEIAKAHTFLQLAAKLLPANYPTHHALGRLHAADGNWAEALREFKKSLSVCPEESASYFAVGCAYYALKRFKLSARFMHKAVAAEADFAEAWFWLGIVANRAGDGEAARRFFVNAHESERSNKLYAVAAHTRLPVLPDSEAGPLLGITKRSRRLISNGNSRLTMLMQKELESICGRYPLATGSDSLDRAVK
jgi:tetratricopeptide (TPR) repeat protein